MTEVAPSSNSPSTATSASTVRVVSYNILFSVVCDAAHDFNVRKFKVDALTGEILNMDMKALPHVVYKTE